MSMKPSLKMGFEKQFTSGGRDWSLFLHVTRVARQLIVTGRLQTIQPGGYPLDNLPVQQARERLTRFFYPSHCPLLFEIAALSNKGRKESPRFYTLFQSGYWVGLWERDRPILWRIKPWSNRFTLLDLTIITPFTVPHVGRPNSTV